MVDVASEKDKCETWMKGSRGGIVIDEI